jgi:uncharacterized membrane protein YjgN (DUF898 family)
MNEMTAPLPDTLEPRRDSHVSFIGENGVFRRLVTVGALLEVVTFGFYRFWLTTNMRRHLWTHTSVDGDTLEYTGRGRELLLGFLFALAVLVPIYLLYLYISIELTRYKAFLSLPLFLFFYIFAQFAVFRARRYRLTRTIWRGVRFWMTGSGWAYAAKAFAWQLLNGVTLGLSYPWSVASLERYKMGHTNYGNLEGAFVGRGWAFFKRGWLLWLVAWIPVILFVSVGVYAAYLKSNATGAATGQIGSLIFLASLSLIILPFVFAAFKAIEWKWWLESIRFGEVRFQSDLTPGALIGNYWALIGMTVLAMIAGIVFMVIVIGAGMGLAYAFGVDFNAIGKEMQAKHFSMAFIPLIGVYILSYLGLIQLVGIVRRIYLIQRIWKIVADSITVQHLEAADHVLAEGQPASAFGEGLADGLDLAGF